MLKPIPDFPDYFASDDGEIYSMKPRGGNSTHPAKPPKEPRLMKKSIHNRRYMISVVVAERRIKTPIAPLILSAFVSRRPKGMYACHGINRMLDDSLKNIYWATPQQNVLDKKRDGTAILGESVHTAKLNEFQVRIIKKSCYPNIKKANIQYGIPVGQIAKIFNVTDGAIQAIINHTSWKHLSLE